MSATRDQILASSDRKRTEVDVPEWGTTVFVQDFATLDLDRSDEAIGDLAGAAAATVSLGTFELPSHLTFGAGNHFESYGGNVVNHGKLTKVGAETI